MRVMRTEKYLSKSLFFVLQYRYGKTAKYRLYRQIPAKYRDYLDKPEIKKKIALE